MQTIISWNVNGIRSIASKGFTSWLNKSRADVVCLQEIKATGNQIPEELLEHKKYKLISLSAEKKGYSGVAILVKKKIKILKTQLGLSELKFRNEARTIILHFENYILINCYFPNGQRDHARVPYKLDYCQAISREVKKLKKLNKPVIVTGDYNTAHREVDLRNPTSNRNSTGFLEIEKAWIDQFIKEGNRDCFRELHPEKKEVYSWWTYRNNCRERNIGWRIDYFFISQKHMSLVKDCKYLHEVAGSDHCPVKLRIDL